MTDLDTTRRRVRPVAKENVERAFRRLDSLAKPRRSLGHLEELAARYVALRHGIEPLMGRKQVFVFVGDHKVVEEGVSAYPAQVTGLMVQNFLRGGAAINVLARQAGAKVEVLDIGMAADVGRPRGLVRRNVKRGTDNIAKGPAMTTGQALQAIEAGIERAERACRRGVTMVATGDMGIGNTTPAAALMAAFLRVPPAEVAGPGTGLDAKGVRHKAQVIEKALAVNASRLGNPLETLAAVGGLEIAGICGLCIGGAALRMAVLVDGYISTAGALAALRICPAVKDYLFFSHRSAEPGHQKFFEQEKARPILDLGMRLGEGTGAAIAMQILEDAVAIYTEMATFAEAGIRAGA